MKTKTPIKGRSSARSVRALVAAADAQKKHAEVKEARTRRKYRCKRVVMDEFFKLRRQAESLGLLVGLERAVSEVFIGALAPRSYFLFIDGVCHRVESLQGACDFLSGFCAGVTASRGLACHSGDVPVVAVERVMGR